MSRLRTLGTLVLSLIAAACSDSTGLVPGGQVEVALAVVAPAAISAEEERALGDAFDLVDAYRVTIIDDVTRAVVADTAVSITSGAPVHTLAVTVPESAFGRTVTITLVASAEGVELYRSVTTVSLDDTITRLPVELEIRYTGPGIRGAITDGAEAGLEGVAVRLFSGEELVDEAVTEVDGTFLFVDVAPGSYSVLPEPPEEVLDMCPGSRDVLLGSTDAIGVANFRVSTGTCTTRVLVLSGGDFDDTAEVESLLTGRLNLEVSTFFHVNRLPDIDYLSRHDVVLLFMNGLFDESVSLGNLVEEYVARGGNVVLGSFYWQGRSDSGLGSVGWGALENIDPFTSEGGARYEPGALDVESVLPQHPLTDGLLTLSATSYWGGVSEIQGVTQVVARWLDGTPLVGYRRLEGGQRIVGVTLFPAAGVAATGDVTSLWENAVWWAATGGGAP